MKNVPRAPCASSSWHSRGVTSGSGPSSNVRATARSRVRAEVTVPVSAAEAVTSLRARRRGRRPPEGSCGL
jgi:hypothetical protein